MSSRPPRPFPVYPSKPLRHGGGARIMLSRRSFYLGKWGSPASIEEYERLRLAHAAGSLLAKPKPVAGLTISRLCALWLREDPRGTSDCEVVHTARAMTVLERLFGPTPATSFKARQFEDIQVAMIEGSWAIDGEEKPDWSRSYINAMMGRLLRVFKWAERKGHVNAGSWTHLKTVGPVRKNDRRVRNCSPRRPCDWDRQVVPAMKEMYPVVAAMVQVQFYGGMRPGEVVTMRRCEIDQAGPAGTWLYQPAEHKGTHRGQDLVKVLGPQAQAALSPWLLKAEPDGFVFPPVRNRAGRGRFSVASYHRAICEACTAAKVERFTAYQLRHLCRLRVTRSHGLDAARAVLGHTSLGMSVEYAKGIDIETAAAVMRKIG